MKIQWDRGIEPDYWYKAWVGSNLYPTYIPLSVLCMLNYKQQYVHRYGWEGHHIWIIRAGKAIE